MVIATIKSAKVMKTPENPKAKTLKAMVQSTICNSSLKNDKIVLKPPDVYNGWKEDLFGLFRLSSLFRLIWSVWSISFIWLRSFRWLGWFGGEEVRG